MQVPTTPAPPPADQVHAAVRDYYGSTLETSADLKTSACCSTEDLPAKHKAILGQLEDEVLAKFYGCGSPLPPALDGCTVLDLGCGTGRDVFLAAALAGPNGRVIGVDMTAEQLKVAERHAATHAERFGFDTVTTDFRLGTIEDLAALGIEDDSVDVVISNCVLNLTPDKHAAFAEIVRVLKPGGELYFSDVFADRRVPADVAADPVIHGECLGGALYEEDFRRMLIDLGIPDYRIVSSRPIVVEDEAIAAKTGGIQFSSKTVRAFKVASLEDRCEDYGQVAFYRGGIDEQPHAFLLDDHHLFEKDRPMLVCGNSAAMVQETRYGRYFDVLGDRSTHFGLFDCAPAPASTDGEASGGCC
ncbi:MAG: methyltransferase domain-containing protein [Bacteroidota bacterium]